MKVKALSQPSIGSLSIWAGHSVHVHSHPVPGTILSILVSGAEIEQHEQNPIQLQAVLALLFLCSHFRIIKAALESIRVSLVSF